LKIRNG